MGQTKAKTVEMPTEEQAGNNFRTAFETMFRGFNRLYNRAEGYKKLADDLAVIRIMVLEGRADVAAMRLNEMQESAMANSTNVLREMIDMIGEFKETYIGVE